MHQQIERQRRARIEAVVLVCLVFVVVTAAACVSGHPPAARRPAAAPAGPQSVRVPPPTATTATTTSDTHQPTTTTTAPPNPRIAVQQAWLAAITAFYKASRTGDPGSAALRATLVPGGPDYRQETTFIAAQAVSGVVGPATWQIGNVVAERVNGQQALISGCSYDGGSRYRSSGLAAPLSLGGSPGLTAYLATMQLVAGRWLLYATRVSAPSSPQEAGPCHDFVP